MDWWTEPKNERDWKSPINVSLKTYSLCDSEPSNGGFVKVGESNGTNSIGNDRPLETGNSLCKAGTNINELKDCSTVNYPPNMLNDVKACPYEGVEDVIFKPGPEQK